MTKTLKQLCEDIEAGYEVGLCMADHPLNELIEQLSNMTGEIKKLCDLSDRLAGVDGNLTVVQGVLWFEDGTTLDIQ